MRKLPFKINFFWYTTKWKSSSINMHKVVYKSTFYPQILIFPRTQEYRITKHKSMMELNNQIWGKPLSNTSSIFNLGLFWKIVLWGKVGKIFIVCDCIRRWSLEISKNSETMKIMKKEGRVSNKGTRILIRGLCKYWQLMF